MAITILKGHLYVLTARISSRDKLGAILAWWYDRRSLIDYNLIMNNYFLFRFYMAKIWQKVI